MRAWRDALVGACVGALLAVGRARVGFDLLEVPLVSGEARAAFLVGALALSAFGLGRGARESDRAPSVGALAAGAAASFAFLTLAWPAAWWPASLWGCLFVAAGLTLALHLASRWSAEELATPGPVGADPVAAGPVAADPDGSAATDGVPSAPPGPLESLGLLLLGAGLARALGAAARSVRLLGGGTADDEAASAVAFLALLALGAAALGPVAVRLASPRITVALAALGATLTAGRTDWAARALGSQRTLEQGLERPAAALRRVGIELPILGRGDFGTAAYDLQLAAQLLVVPALLVGVALVAARERRRLAALLYGGCAGSIWLHADGGYGPRLLAVDDAALAAAALTDRAMGAGATRVAAGALTAAGLLLAASRRGRASGPVLGLAAVVLSFGVLADGRHGRPPLSPWGPIVAYPEVLRSTPAGLASVEPLGSEPLALVHRARVTPTVEQVAHDLERIELSLALLGPRDADAEGPRVLFVGQLTVDRASALERAGARVDRTAPWFGAYADLESALFPGDFRPAGELVAPAVARRRLAEGGYDLVLVPPISGPIAPSLSPLRPDWAAARPLELLPSTPPDGTLAVLWQDAAAPLAAAPLGRRVLVLPRGDLAEWSLAVVLGEPHAGPGAPRLVPAGRRRAVALRANPLAFFGLGPALALDRTPQERALFHGRELGERLAAAGRAGAAASFTDGLALHLAAQRPSSPWTAPLESVEIDPEALAAWRADALRGPLDPTARRLWEGVAAVLVAKRRPALLVDHVAAVADAHAPWPVLEGAVARGWDELLEPERAREWRARSGLPEPEESPSEAEHHDHDHESEADHPAEDPIGPVLPSDG